MTRTGATLAADWAEHDKAVAAGDATILRGEPAAEFVRTMLERVRVAWPRLDPSEAVTGRSPRRQVRLPQAIGDGLDQLAAAQGRAASEAMRTTVAPAG